MNIFPARRQSALATSVRAFRPVLAKPAYSFGESATWLHGQSDLYAIDGNIYMTLSGPDGLYLFGARDHSLIPEPSSLAVLAICVATVCFFARSRKR